MLIGRIIAGGIIERTGKSPTFTTAQPNTMNDTQGFVSKNCLVYKIEVMRV